MPDSSPGRSQPFRLESLPDLELLRRTLEDRGYTAKSLAERVDLADPRITLGTPLDIAAALRQTASPTPLNTLARLFVLARAVSEDDARTALAPVELEPLLAGGLLERQGAAIRAAVGLLPFAGLLLARDFPVYLLDQAPSADFVPGIGSATLSVANLTVRRRGELALDLGTGSGFLALTTASHAARVIGTDVNPRALQIATLNARLNGLTNIELRQGSLFEPVADCRFDLIVSNPPFVMSPGREFCYRDSGWQGDALCERIIRQAPAMLRDDGFCTVIFNWHHRDEKDWAERPTEWLRGSGCDAWLLWSDRSRPLPYTLKWLRDAGVADLDRCTQLLDEWLECHQRLGAGMISFGALILRKRSGGRNWLRTEQAPPGGATGPCSSQILRLFAAQDILESLPNDEALLDLRFRLTDDHRLVQTLRAHDGRFTVLESQLLQTSGFAFIGEVDRLVGDLLSECNGSRPLREVVARVAANLRVDPSQVARSVPPIVKKLLAAGFLICESPA